MSEAKVERKHLIAAHELIERLCKNPSVTLRQVDAKDEIAQALATAEASAQGEAGIATLKSALAWLEKGCGGVLSLNDGTTYDLDPDSMIEAAVENGWTPPLPPPPKAEP